MEGSMRHIGKSIPQKIQATRVFNSGEEFGSLRLLQELKQDSPSLTRKRVIGALGDMLERNTVWRIGQGLYIKPQSRHWIHKQRLSNVQVTYFAERCFSHDCRTIPRQRPDGELPEGGGRHHATVPAQPDRPSGHRGGRQPAARSAALADGLIGPSILPDEEV
jgi:hypothetical protein